jgi:hypothetical protein
MSDYTPGCPEQLHFIGLLQKEAPTTIWRCCTTILSGRHVRFRRVIGPVVTFRLSIGIFFFLCLTLVTAVFSYGTGAVVDCIAYLWRWAWPRLRRVTVPAALGQFLNSRRTTYRKYIITVLYELK